MGVEEDSEPPLKRIKVLVKESNSLSESSFAKEPLDFSLGNLMARPLTSQGETETIGSKGIIKKSEFIRIITSALYSLGFDKSGALLEEESGIRLQSPGVDLFLRQVRDGKWDESVTTLNMLGLSDEITVRSASFLLLEQKFFELLAMEKVTCALATLRNEIVPLHFNLRRVHELASCIIFPSKCIPSGDSGQGTSNNAKSRSKIMEKLEKLLPARVFIPQNRLEHLVEKALDVQRDACVFHNTPDLSLYSDHQCGKNQIPSQTLQILQGHGDEVWYLQFSHNGRYLASSSKDQSAIIWEVGADSQLSQKHTLVGHQKPVSTVSWSPDDKHCLTCGLEEVIRLWDVSSGQCLRVYEKNGVGLVSCGWLPDGKGIFAGMTDRSICLWGLNGRELESWKGQKTLKISDMAISNDGKRVISICKESAVLLLDRETKFEELIEEEDLVTSFSLSSDDKFLLVNLINQEIHLWSIESDIKLISKYKGQKRARFVIRSCFGGFEQAFIASGSEDSQVYIWHRFSQELLMALPGHSGAVNCVSWNPTNLHMLASASDDRTIRIWGLDRINPKHRGHSNGVNHPSNGH